MKTQRLVAMLCLAIASCWPSGFCLAVPPPSPQRLPGLSKGRVEAKWLAPNVLVINERVGARSNTTVRWFTDEGLLFRELTGERIHASTEFIYDLDDSTVYAVSDTWKCVLPAMPTGYVTATLDNRILVRQFSPAVGQVTVETYVRGKIADTVGPFNQYRGTSVRLSQDGSTAMLTWKGVDQKVVQVVVTGSDGGFCFQADCDMPAHSPVAAPDGRGVLLRRNVGDAAKDDFVYYTKEGKVASFAVGPNATFVDWLPHSTTALISTSIGEVEKFSLVEVTTGKIEWSIPDPFPNPHICCAAIAVDKYVLFHGYDFAAVDSKTGHMVAVWKPEHRNPVGLNGAWFRVFGERAFLVAGNEFTEVNLDDIAQHRNGWR